MGAAENIFDKGGKTFRSFTARATTLASKEAEIEWFGGGV